MNYKFIVFIHNIYKDRFINIHKKCYIYTIQLCIVFKNVFGNTIQLLFWFKKQTKIIQYEL